VTVLLVGLTAGLAAYLRSLDYRRTVAVSETRRAERVAVAADLHDFVAHHVTGILVQTQTARMMAARQPQDLDPVPAGIERAATEAPASMRRTVGVLRDSGPESADRRPVGDLAAVADLVEGFASPCREPSCTVTRPCPTTCRTRRRPPPSGSCRRRCPTYGATRATPRRSPSGWPAPATGSRSR
jgi:hypothetical protein